MTRSVGPRPSRSAMLLLGTVLVLACSNEPAAPRPVASVTVEPGSATLVLGGSLQLTATPKDAAGAALQGRVVTWGSSDLAVATVSPAGLVIGVANGPVTITATSETKSDAADMTVVTVVFAGVGVGSGHTCGAAADGATYCWGDNLYGQLGNGDRKAVPQASPTLVAGGTSLTMVSAASGSGGDTGGHSCGVTPGGGAFCWGYNSFGQVGNGDVNGPDLCLAEVPCAAAPVAVMGGLIFAAVSVGHYHTCGVTTSGDAYCWGGQRGGELGIGIAGYRPSPALVTGGLTFAQVSAGYYHTCGVTPAGAAYCWGFNRAGQVGDGTTTDRSIPVAVAGGVSFLAVSAGGDHTCGVTAAGAAYCWGFNGNGELGDGTTTDRLSPVRIAGSVSFAAVTAGTSHSCGIAAGGAAHCWGFNGEGELGDGTNVSQLSPTPVAGGLSFASVSAGQSHSCGVTGGSILYCWGRNGGLLGDGTTVDRNVPVKVLGQS
jgi:alpha-tubulin suppressor-like RCC1 family protein